LWAGRTIVEERDSTGATTTKRFFGQGFKEGSNAYFYTKDHLGSIREVVDTTGAVRARYDYDPYGRRTKVSGDVDADFGYAGYFEHAATGLKLTQYRAYDPTSGRWLSRDPIGLRGGRNLYAYVGGDPVNKIDPSGLMEGLGTGGSGGGWTGGGPPPGFAEASDAAGEGLSAAETAAEAAELTAAEVGAAVVAAAVVGVAIGTLADRLLIEPLQDGYYRDQERTAQDKYNDWRDKYIHEKPAPKPDNEPDRKCHLLILA
jgi:RHS repeat-associated protein